MHERRQQKGNNSSHENNHSAGSIYVATKPLGRGEKDTMKAIKVGYGSSVCVGRGQTTPVENGNETTRQALMVLQKGSTIDGMSGGSK